MRLVARKNKLREKEIKRINKEKGTKRQEEKKMSDGGFAFCC